jgi:hypothetical protein
VISIRLPLDCEAGPTPKKKPAEPTPFDLVRRQNDMAVRKRA